MHVQGNCRGHCKEKAVIFDNGDTVPHLNRCHGAEPDAVFGQESIISCPKCKGKVTVTTAPFFRDDDSQREHEAWRAASAWNVGARDSQS
jgi:hypothetical protein